MSSSPDTRSFRIVVGMDPGSDHKALLNTAQEFAVALNAELFGHFVEENSLFDLSGLPFAKGIFASGQRAQPLSFDRMREAVEQQANLFERTLEFIAKDAHLHVSSKITKGDFIIEIQSSTSKDDIILIQGTPDSFAISGIMKDVRTLARNARGVVICSGKLKSYTGPVIIIDDGSGIPADGLQVAKSLAAYSHVPIIGIALGESLDEVEKTSQRIKTNFSEDIRIVKLTYWKMENLIEILRMLQPGYVMGSLEAGPFKDDKIAGMVLRGIKSPLVLV